MNMKFFLKKSIDITESDLKNHHVWVTFYEPDEFELIESLGFNLDEVEKALQDVSYSDEYEFPLPSEAASMPFKYLSLSAKITTPSGTELYGYRTSVSLSVLFKGKRYHFNRGLLDLSKEEAAELSSALGEKAIFPLSVYIPALSKTENYNLE